ncbi:hypothetical protein [Thermocrinis sp.]
MRLLTSLFLFFLLALLDFKVAEHHHEDHEFHLDCGLCIVQHQQEHTSEIKLSIDVGFFATLIEEKTKSSVSLSTYRKHTLTRAPPKV